MQFSEKVCREGKLIGLSLIVGCVIAFVVVNFGFFHYRSGYDGRDCIEESKVYLLVVLPYLCVFVFRLIWRIKDLLKTG